MKLKQIIDESFGDYKECSMLLVVPSCTFKCEGCQNKHLMQLPTQEFPDEEIWERFQKNPLTKAIVIGGLEPLDDIMDIAKFIFIGVTKEMEVPLIIYTGYDVFDLDGCRPLEMRILYSAFDLYKAPITVKYGPYIKGRKSVYNEILGVTLASDNQYTAQYYHAL